MRGEKQLLIYLCLKTSFLSLLLSCFFCNYSQAQTPLFSDIQVSDNGINNSIGSANTSRNIGIDLNGNIYVVYANSNEVRIAKSTDNGQSFLPSILVSNTSSSVEPEIAINNTGNIYLAWVENETINFTRSVDGGTIFSTIETFGTITPSPNPDPDVHMSAFENNVYLLVKLYVGSVILLKSNILKKEREFNVLFFISGKRPNFLFFINFVLMYYLLIFKNLFGNY